MGNTGGETPQIPSANVIDEVATLRVDGRDPRAATEHVLPFGFFMPMHLAHPARVARVETHIDAGEGAGNWQLALGNLACPPSGLQAHVRVREREAQVRHG